MNSSNTNLIKDEYEIACIELENEPPSTDLDMEGNALSDRFETDSLLSNDLDAGFGRRRSQSWTNPSELMNKNLTEKDESFLTELDVDFEPGVGASRRTSIVIPNDIHSFASNRVSVGKGDSDSVTDSPTKSDDGTTSNQPDGTSAVRKTFPSFSELQQQTEGSSTLAFLAHFDPEIDLTCLVSQLIPLSQLKSWQSQSSWNWSNLMAEMSELFESKPN